MLDANRSGTYTRPSQALYPHQWSWDSAFIAVGRSWFDAEGARLELETLFDAQWRTGMVPSIVFDPAAPADAYFPGSDVWQSERSPAAPRGRPTSGVTQPPIHARAALLVRRSGFREYFDPLDGSGRGSDGFSWSAALFTDMVLAGQREGGSGAT